MNLSIKEKVYGAVFGYAIGDALGLGTEFMTKQEVHGNYPDGLSHYSQIISDAHRSFFRQGDFSNDTILIKMLIESICAKENFDYMDYAHRLREWYKTEPYDLLAHMRWVLSQDDYEKNPIGVAQRVWKEISGDDTPSDALGKSLFIGMWNADVKKNAHEVCCLTHCQMRCQAASEIIATMANSLMWQEKEASFEELLAIAKEYDQGIVRYLEIARDGEISDFQLDDEASYWFVRKAMGAALWALWHCGSVDETLLTIVNEGGDADTNASLAAGLVALKYGYSTIGKEYVDNLTDRENLLNLSARFTDLLTRKFMHS